MDIMQARTPFNLLRFKQMYFYKKNGKQCLDLTGNLIISFNDELVKAFPKSAGPKSVKVPDAAVLNVGKFNFINRVIITFKVVCFIWGRDRQLKYNKPYRAEK